MFLLRKLIKLEKLKKLKLKKNDESQIQTMDNNVVLELNVTGETEFIIDYYTSAPFAEEIITSSSSKEIIVIGSDEVHYKDILAFTYLPLEVADLSKIKVLLDYK